MCKCHQPQLSEADTIKVAVRVRPLSKEEKEKGATEVLEVTEDHSLIKVLNGRGEGEERAARAEATLNRGV